MFPSPFRFPFRSAFAVATVALSLFAIANCDEDDDSTTPAESAVIGAAGGTLVSGDDVFELLVPAGALSTDVNFTITSVPAPSSPALAPTYAIATTASDGGAVTPTFSAPVVLSFSEQAIALPLLADGGAATFHDISDYRVSAFVSNAWAPLANPSVDAIAGTVEGTATNVSATAYSVVIPSGGSCVAVTEACPEDDGGCALACGASIPGKCAAYAGSVVASCTSSTNSISVSCCYPTGTPTCFTELEPNGCDDPCRQLPGSTAVSCVPEVGPPLSLASSEGDPQSTCCFASGAPVCMAAHVSGSPAPLCASSSPCAAYPGTTVTSCTDVSDGTEATCCLPVGTLPTTLPPPGAAVVDGGAIVSANDAAADADAGGGVNAAGDADAGLAIDAGPGAGDGGVTDATDEGG